MKNKFLKTGLILVVLSLIFALGCKKDKDGSDNPTPDPNNPFIGTWVSKDDGTLEVAASTWIIEDDGTPILKGTYTYQGNTATLKVTFADEEKTDLKAGDEGVAKVSGNKMTVSGFGKKDWVYVKKGGSGGETGTWTQKADLPGVGRISAVGFSIGNKGYIGTGFGRGSEDYVSDMLQDFWEYDPATNSWTQKANFAGGKRWYAVGFSIGNKGYIGTGTSEDGFEKDFWEYDPTSNSWTKKADFAGGGRFWAVSFSIENKGYVGMGADTLGNLRKDFWEYDPSSDSWTQKANFAAVMVSNVVGFSIGNKGYAYEMSSSGTKFFDFWEYDPSSDTWTGKADFAGEVRSHAVGFSIGNKGYMGTGRYDKQDFWEYDPSSDTWTQKADLAGEGRGEAVGFSIGNKGYIGTGNGLLNDFWEFTP